MKAKPETESKKQNQIRKRKLDPKIIRPGDMVEIIRPRFVDRVGYPKSCKDYRKQAKEIIEGKVGDLQITVSQALYIALRSIQTGKPSKNLFGQKNVERIVEKSIQEFSYLLAKLDRFGGPERTVHFKKYGEKLDKLIALDYFKNNRFEVTKVEIKKTGTYFAPRFYGGGWYEDYDWDPGGLDNEKTVKIITVEFPLNLIGDFGSSAKILNEDVRKVEHYEKGKYY